MQPVALRTVEDHLAAALELVAPLEVVTLTLADAIGCALAADVTAAFPLPRFDNSAMDGYAVRVVDLAPGAGAGRAVPLPVSADIPAGTHPERPLEPGTAARIMTGAPVPDGADAVVPVEDTDGRTDVVIIRASDRGVAQGANIRLAGEDVPAGATVLSAGEELTVARAGLLATLGADSAAVRRRPRVAVISTGSELTPAGEPLAAAAIYDSNGPMLRMAVARAGAVAVAQPSVPDDAGRFAAVAASAAASADLVITCGGISAGAYEVVKESLSGELEFSSVAMQPGMPQGLGRLHGTPVVAVPGNPVSSYVSFLVFVRPMLRKMLGFADAVPPQRYAVLAEPVRRRPDKRQYRRATFDPESGAVRIVGGPGSHLMAALGRSDCIVVVPPGDGAMEAGERVRVVDFD